MSFGELLKGEFDRLCIPGINYNEVGLFRELVNAFVGVKASTGLHYQIEEIHGTRYIVEFDLSTPYFLRGAGRARCELGDMMFLVINGHEARLTIMQHKCERTMVNYNDKFTAQMDQLYLLNQRPEFIYNGMPCNILYNAVLPSIGSFGTFRGNGSPYEMAYYSADCLSQPNNSISKKSRRRISLDDGVIKEPLGVDQVNYCENIAEFGNYLVEMRIGEKYDSYVDAIAELNNIDIANTVNNMGLNLNFTFDINRPAISARNIIIIRVI